MNEFRVGITHDFLKPDGSLGFGDIGLDSLKANPRIAWEFMPDCGTEIPREMADRYDALLVLAPRISSSTVDRCKRLTLVARFGVGYDTVDVTACTRNDVMLTITPSGVRRPVAVSALTFLLALAHKLFAKDRLTRSGGWHQKLDYMGIGLTGRTLGVIGLGNIGRELLRVAAPLEMRHIGFDPYISADAARTVGVEAMDLETLLRQADFVCICCALTPATHHLLNAERLRLMKPTAFLINVARGPIVEQKALTQMLSERKIAGAGLDVFETEPIDPADPLLLLDNVIVAPHAICWTDEMSRGNGESACKSILEVAAGHVPTDVVNRDVLDRQGLREKLVRFAG